MSQPQYKSTVSGSHSTNISESVKTDAKRVTSLKQVRDDGGSESSASITSSINIDYINYFKLAIAKRPVILVLVSEKELKQHKTYLLEILEAQAAKCKFYAHKYKDEDDGFYKREVEHLELIINLIKQWKK